MFWKTAMNQNSLLPGYLSKPDKQQGFTLVEIMIALLLGVFLLGGVMGVFINTKQTYRMQDALSRLQENGRYAMDAIGRNIRMADYRQWECTDYVFTDPPLVGADDDTTDANTLNGTDRITVRWVVEPCEPGDSPQNRAFFITTSRNLRLNTDDIVEGVENMQILYGADVDDDGVPNYYVPAGTAGLNMTTVVSVRVSLLLRTVDDNITADPLPYTYVGVTATPTDNRIRRVFTSTFVLRNRIQ
jgi:type IV pilus assembly protein PilW